VSATPGNAGNLLEFEITPVSPGILLGFYLMLLENLP